MLVEIKSPTRVDLAGGTLDCWPLYNFVGSCWTINLSISIYTGVKLKLRDDKKVLVTVKDLNYHKMFDSIDELFICDDKELDILKACLNYWKPQKGLEIETYSDSPVGGGLGGSSSLMISLLKAFGKIFNKNWELKQLVTVAHNLEASLLHTPTGTQDYVPAAQTGLNLIKYSPEGFSVETLPYDVNYFSERMLVVYTGRSHHSGINNWQVLKEAVEKRAKTLEALQEVAEISKDLRQICINGEWEQLPQVFKREFNARTKLSEGFSSPEILNLEVIALKNGAEAVKICGAGGGGCVMIWSPPDKKEKLSQEIQSKGFQVLAANPLR